MPCWAVRAGGLERSSSPAADTMSSDSRIVQAAFSGFMAALSKLVVARGVAWPARLRLSCTQGMLQTCAIAPVTIKWYEATDRALAELRPPAMKALIATVCEMVLFNPVMNAYYLLLTAVVARGPRAVRDALNWALFRAMCRDYVLFWGPVGLATYRLVAQRFRLPFTSACGLLWQIYLARTAAAAAAANEKPIESEPSDFSMAATVAGSVADAHK